MKRSLICVAIVMLEWLPTFVYGQGGETPLPTTRPAIYAGRTFEEWRRISLDDLDPETRNDSLAALAAFGRNGREKEAVAAIMAALNAQSPERPLNFTRAYDAIRTLGDAGDPLFIAGIKNPSSRHQRAALMPLQERRPQLPGAELTTALLDKVKDKNVSYSIRDLACRALGKQVAYQQSPIVPGSGGPRPTVVVVPSNAAPAVIPGIEPYLKQVVPVLEQTLRDDDPRVSDGAAVALLQFHKQRPALVATVLDYLDSALTSPKEIPASRTPEDDSGVPLEMRKVVPRERIAVGAARDAFDEPVVARVAPAPGGIRRMDEEISGVRRRRTISASGYSYNQTDVYTELARISRTSRDQLLAALPQLKSLRDRHPQVRPQLDMVIQVLQPPVYRSVPSTDDEGF